MFTEATACPDALVDRRRDADAERREAVVCEGGDEALELSEKGVLVRQLGRLDRATGDRSVSIDEARGQLRPAQVDRDHAGERSFRVWLR